ncbi:glycosyltransferase [Allocoprobacillus halotolerans]|uniref:Glycosyltransferase n=1 Tax=Allocoprobacillus halotolerans TaxID=2944914 RepID=A0ABY5I1Z9_9FIRM|nr:glycosyltransferase family 2 protein [Allocoprobacillus halotolerans]UTY38146.1 glycosyltransferase [Allocoprobacillus halotolerans]
MVMISVIMSVYNDAKYLEKSIQSILNQTFKDFEFIICNDCSTDSSLSIIQEFQKLDSRIKIINNSTNLGLAASLNKCIEISLGQYIARMDSDDISFKNRLEVEYNFLMEHQEYDVVGSKSITINENDEPCKEFSIHSNEVHLLDAIKKLKLFTLLYL